MGGVLGGGGGGSDSSVTTQIPEFQRRALQFGYDEARDLYNEGPYSFYPGSTVAPFNPLSGLAQGATLNAAQNFFGGSLPYSPVPGQPALPEGFGYSGAFSSPNTAPNTASNTALPGTSSPSVGFNQGSGGLQSLPQTPLSLDDFINQNRDQFTSTTNSGYEFLPDTLQDVFGRLAGGDFDSDLEQRGQIFISRDGTILDDQIAPYNTQPDDYLTIERAGNQGYALEDPRRGTYITEDYNPRGEELGVGGQRVLAGSPIENFNQEAANTAYNQYLQSLNQAPQGQNPSTGSLPPGFGGNTSQGNGLYSQAQNSLSRLLGGNAVQPGTVSGGSAYSSGPGYFNRNDLNEITSGNINPFINDASRAIRQESGEELGRTLGSIAGGASVNGGYGSSRQGIAEGIAIDSANENLTNALSNLNLNAFEGAQGRRLQGLGIGQGVENLGANLRSNEEITNANLSNQRGIEQARLNQNASLNNQQLTASALGLTPNISALPFDIINQIAGIGNQNFGYDQSLINSDINRYSFNQDSPFQNLNRYASIINPSIGAAGTTQRTSDGGGSGFGNLLGAGLTLSGFFPSIGGSFTGLSPFTSTQSALGALTNNFR